MLDKSLFICYSTPNYTKLTNLFLDSLQSIHVTRIEHLLDNPDAELLKQTGFRTDLWYYSVRNKIQHLINILHKYTLSTDIHYFIFTDCDIIYKNNITEWYNLEKYIHTTDKDIYFMRENTSERVNSGFFIMKNHNIQNMIDFFTEVLETMDNTDKNDMFLGDQTVINNLKPKLNYDFIPNSYVIFGTDIYDIHKALFHHAVWCKDVDEKIKQIEYINVLVKYKPLYKVIQLVSPAITAIKTCIMRCHRFICTTLLNFKV